jgi:RHS repeat-associated protein
LFGGNGNFTVRRGIIGNFNSYANIFGPSSSKTCDDAVLENTTSYWYDTKNRSITDTLYFYHADYLGTPIAMTDSSGTLVWRAEHTPFGGIYALPVSTISNNLRFPGQYFDGETGLAQNWFRDYDAKIGRYWEIDPVKHFISKCKKTYGSSLAQAYSYSNLNPITNFDVKGLTITTSGCSATQTALLLKAAGDVEAASQKCLPCEEREKFKKHIRNLHIFCVERTTTELLRPDLGPNCGADLGADSIEIDYRAFDSKQCGCLQATVMHETLHEIGYLDIVGGGARDAETQARKCFNCATSH